MSQYDNSESSSVNASVGFNQTEGLDARVGGSVTVGKDTVWEVPSTTIIQTLEETTAEVSWQFTPQAKGANNTFSVYATWLGTVARGAYPDGGTNGEIAIPTGANIFAPGNNTTLQQNCNVPYPFTAWTLAQPTLSSLSCPSGSTTCSSSSTPISVSNSGGVFTIHGTAMYPGQVTAVLVGGNPIKLSSHIDLLSDTEIEVSLGCDSCALGSNPVQVNTQYTDAAGTKTNQFSNQLTVNLTD